MKKLLTAISLILAAVILASCALSENDSLSADTKPEEGATYGYTHETAALLVAVAAEQYCFGHDAA